LKERKFLYEPKIFNALSRRRFIAHRKRELRAHLGRTPSIPEQIIIQRVVAIEWDLRRYDAKLESGEDLSGHALRARLAAENRLRLDLVALGLQPRTQSVKPMMDAVEYGRLLAARQASS
jgi:hypothetical protein